MMKNNLKNYGGFLLFLFLVLAGILENHRIFSSKTHTIIGFFLVTLAVISIYVFKEK